MRLTPWEEERLLVFAAAELARRHRATGLGLNGPEVVALMCDAMLEAARAGATFAEVEAAGLAAVVPEDVLDGVRELVDEVRLEVLLDEGTRLIVLVDPLGRGRPTAPDGPGAVVPAADAVAGDALARPGPDDIVELTVTSRSRRRIRVSSHHPFERVNLRLEFDRARARGRRLDLPAGDWVGWEPGEARTVRLVRYRGTGDT